MSTIPSSTHFWGEGMAEVTSYGFETDALRVRGHLEPRADHRSILAGCQISRA